MEPMAAETESVELGDRVRAAGRVDMEFKTALAALRHYLENLLAAFSYAVSSRDDHHLGELIGGVEVRLKGCTTCSRSWPSAQQVISWFSLGAAPRRQTVTNLIFTSRRASYSTAPSIRIGKQHSSPAVLRLGPTTADSRPDLRYGSGSNTPRVEFQIAHMLAQDLAALLQLIPGFRTTETPPTWLRLGDPPI